MDNVTNKHICFRKSEDTYTKWLVQVLGPVILGVKPAEILSFPKSDSSTIRKIKKINQSFSLCTKMSFKIFKYNENSIKVLFYNIEALNNTLIDRKNLSFLKAMNYPKEYSLDTYIEHLTTKIKMGNIPEEIGIFLGYPLKDVMGFIGHPSLKLTKINGWRVYGNPYLSDRRYEEFSLAKTKISSLLEFYTPEKVLLTV